MDAGSFSLPVQPLSGHLRGNHDYAKKIPLKVRVKTSFEKRAKISQLNWRLAKIGATFQATNQNKTLLPCVYSNYTPQSGTKILEKFFFVNAHYLKRQNYFQINGFLQTLRDPAFFGRPTNTSFQGEGGRGESVRLRCVENAPHVYNFRNSFVQDCR